MPEKSPPLHETQDQWDAGRRVSFKDGRRALIQRARPEHAAELAELRTRVIAEGQYTLATPQENSPDQQSELARIEDLLGKPGCIYLTCLLEDRPIGLVEIQNGSFRRTQHLGQLTVFVAPDQRGQGAGRALSEALLDWAATNPLIEKVSLAVFSNNERAIKLQEGLSFAREGYCPRDMRLEDGSYIDSVLMYRLVDPASHRTVDNDDIG